MTAWAIIRDVVLTGLAGFILVTQTISGHPDPYLIGAAVSLTAPATGTHVYRAVASGGRRSSDGSE